MSQLAILGGTPVIDQSTHPIRYVWPEITKDIEDTVLKQLHTSISIYDRSGIFAEFENEFARYHARKHALLCSSGTLAIHSMFVAADFKVGDEVICPAYTFFATVTPLLHTGAVPVLCDCDKNGNIDPRELRNKITKRTKGLIVTHMWGIPCAMDDILAICKEHKLILLEDCSHAHGARYKGKLVGTFGDMAAWSLQGSKNISGGEGGVLVTDKDEYYHRALMLGHYNKRCKQELPEDSPYYPFAVTGMGLKYRAHPIAIAIALNLFRHIDEMLTVKRIYARMFEQRLDGFKGIKLPYINKEVEPSWYALTLQYNAVSLDGLPIEKFVGALMAEGLIDVDRPMSTSPLNLLPLFQKPQVLFPIYNQYPFSYKPGDFPKAELFYKKTIKIPIWHSYSGEGIMNNYVQGFVKVLTHYKELL